MSWVTWFVSKLKNPKHMVTTWRYILVQASNQGVNPGASNCKDLFGKALETRGSSVIEATVSDNSLGPISLDGSLWKSWKVKLRLGMGWVRPSGSLMVTSEVNLEKGSNNSTEVGFFYEIDSLNYLRFESRVTLRSLSNDQVHLRKNWLHCFISGLSQPIFGLY